MQLGLPTLGQEVEFIDYEALVLAPRKVKGLWRHEIGNAIYAKGVLMSQLRNLVH